MKLRISLYTVLLINIFRWSLSAQGIFPECPPGNPVVFESHTADDLVYWNQPYWHDPVTGHPYLAEEEISLSCGVPFYFGPGPLHFRYILTLQLDADTTQKTIIDSDSLPAANTVWYNNQPNNLFSSEARHFGNGNLPAEKQFGFDLEVHPPTTQLSTAFVIWRNALGHTQLPAIPYGKHHIEWIVSDSAGNSGTCSYFFEVKDAAPPGVTCFEGLDINLHANGFSLGTTILYASDILQFTGDNYSLPGQLMLGLRKKGTGSGFPYNPDGSPQNSITYNCGNLGVDSVELWSIDLNGNADYCSTWVTITPDEYYCEPPYGIAGSIKTPAANQGVSGVQVSIDYIENSGDTLHLNTIGTTDDWGYYDIYFNQFYSSSQIIVTPTFNKLPLNGVTVWDLVLISRHILNYEPLNTPYKIIAADVNRSGTVTTFDVVELRKLLLGTYDSLPENTSWRFVDKSQVFQIPNNPFAETIREHLILTSYLNETDFAGVKIGDVDETATPHFQSAPEDRNLPLRAVKLKDQYLKAGETVNIHFEIPEDLLAAQLTMSGTGIRLENLDPGSYTSDHFAIFADESNERSRPLFTAVLEDGSAGFDAAFTALKDGYLHEMLALSDEITPTKTFDRSGNEFELILAFEGKNDGEDNTILLSNSPNPWRDFTRITFCLPKPASVTHLITDQHGKAILSKTASYSNGYQQIIFNRDDFPEPGVYYYHLITDQSVNTQKLILLH